MDLEDHTRACTYVDPREFTIENSRSSQIRKIIPIIILRVLSVLFFSRYKLITRRDPGVRVFAERIFVGL